MTPRRITVYVSAAGLAVFLAWLMWSMFTAKGALERVREHVRAAQVAIEKVDQPRARAEALAAQVAAADARDSLDQFPCRVVAAIPFVGAPVASATGISDTVSYVADNVVPRLLDVSASIDLKHLRLPGGGIDLTMLEKARKPLDDAADSLPELNRLASDIPSARYVPMINTARSTVREQVAEVDGLITNARLAVDVIPPMFGRDGDRRYLVAFQTNAELRGTGGLVGGVAMLRANDGHIEVLDVGSNAELENGATGINLGPDFAHLYGPFNATTIWQNTNTSPHFPYAGEIWRDLLRQQFDVSIDGAVAVDPIALSYFLEASGPVKLASGEVISADNVVRLTEADVYSRFPIDQMARKEYLTTIARAVLDKVASGQGSVMKIGKAIVKAVGEGRISVWSAHESEQKVLEGTALGHAVPVTTAPYANLTIVNSGPSKLDYYLRRDLKYAAEKCTGDRRESTVTVRLTNTAPPGLPDYVSKLKAGFDAPSGTNLSFLNLYATTGAELKSLTVDGDDATQAVVTGRERGHPVFTFGTGLVPGQTMVVTFTLSEPVVAGQPEMPVQPMAVNGKAEMDVPVCG
ncbi:MAG: DUF4012 domain-containing protein [Nocardiaceae bacterium]|nr:DUF4012 domain-containing protein [Nocardiaceae bacterium]